MATAAQDSLLSIKDVAARLGIAVNTARDYRTKGYPFLSDKAMKSTGGSLRWRESELNEYIASLEYTTDDK